MTSNDSQIRCNFVDLYYALYGSRRPTCLVGSESSMLTHFPKIPKLSAENRYRSPSPTANVIEEMGMEEIPTPDIKMEPELIIEQEEVAIKTTDIIEIKEVMS